MVNTHDSVKYFLEERKIERESTTEIGRESERTRWQKEKREKRLIEKEKGDR